MNKPLIEIEKFNSLSEMFKNLKVYVAERHKKTNGDAEDDEMFSLTVSSVAFVMISQSFQNARVYSNVQPKYAIKTFKVPEDKINEYNNRLNVLGTFLPYINPDGCK